ncbi:hypothetical protein H4582DRAFT_2109020 [Lactarius indigo]|nr:hypothetical protein H4582DRAFT_2109020 [Lactarius indigo]
MAHTLWLTIDEKSMLTTPQLALLSQVTGIVRTGQQSVEASMPFGGLNIILLSNFHQFPPVAAHNKELYNYTPSPHDDLSLLGKHLYNQFDIVTGDCSADDLSEMRKLILGTNKCHPPDFTKQPWADVILVTPCNSVCTLWNESMLTCHSCNASQTHYIIYALDNCQKKTLTWQQCLVIAHLKLDHTNCLPNKIDLAVGMKAMILENIAPNADLANGS